MIQIAQDKYRQKGEITGGRKFVEDDDYDGGANFKQQRP
jgi:hypothetical protein